MKNLDPVILAPSESAKLWLAVSVKSPKLSAFPSTVPELILGHTPAIAEKIPSPFLTKWLEVQQFQPGDHQKKTELQGLKPIIRGEVHWCFKCVSSLAKVSPAATGVQARRGTETCHARLVVCIGQSMERVEEFDPNSI